MATRLQLAALFFCLLISAAASASRGRKPRPRAPCRELVFYFHDILYNGNNYNNATSTIIGSPPWGNKTTEAKPFAYGDLVVFNDPITLDNDLHSPPVGRAQGMYLYYQKSSLSALLGFSFVFNSTEHVGTLNFFGADPTVEKTRDISVIGGRAISSWLEALQLCLRIHSREVFTLGFVLMLSCMSAGNFSCLK